MTNIFKTFAADEAGAVTVDWVVLTAALVGLGLAVMTVVRNGADNLSKEAGGMMCNISIGSDGALAFGNAAMAANGACG